MVRIDAKKLVARYALADVVEHDLGPPERTGRALFWCCPFHDEADASFVIFPDGKFKCFGCGQHGDVIDYTMLRHGVQFREACDLLTGGQFTQLTPQEVQVRADRRAAQRRRDEESVAYMRTCQDHVLYHEQLTPAAVDWWKEQGIAHSTMLDYQLGYCSKCPTDVAGQASYTIPVTHRGVLLNIRHRLDTQGGDKYRPHRGGLGVQLFNADLLDDIAVRELVLVEGEKKALVLFQYGVPTVGTYGVQAFLPQWFDWFNRIRRVFIAFDPGAKVAAWNLGLQFADRGVDARVLNLLAKPDDMFVDGLDVDVFYAFMKCARRVR